MRSVCRPTSKSWFHQPQRCFLSNIETGERKNTGPHHVSYCHYHGGTVMRRWTCLNSCSVWDNRETSEGACDVENTWLKTRSVDLNQKCRPKHTHANRTHNKLVSFCLAIKTTPVIFLQFYWQFCIMFLMFLVWQQLF